MKSITFDKSKYHLVGEMEAWCNSHIGPGGWVSNEGDLWNCYAFFGNTTFEFKEYKHYYIFILRWA